MEWGEIHQEEIDHHSTENGTTKRKREFEIDLPASVLDWGQETSFTLPICPFFIVSEEADFLLRASDSLLASGSATIVGAEASFDNGAEEGEIVICCTAANAAVLLVVCLTDIGLQVFTAPLASFLSLLSCSGLTWGLSTPIRV